MIEWAADHYREYLLVTHRHLHHTLSPWEQLQRMGAHVRAEADQRDVPYEEFVEDRHLLEAMAIIVRFPHTDTQLAQWQLSIAAALGLHLAPTRIRTSQLIAEGRFSERNVARSHHDRIEYTLGETI